MGVNASIEGSNPSFSASGTERCPSGLRSATGNRVRAERCVAGSNPALTAERARTNAGLFLLGERRAAARRRDRALAEALATVVAPETPNDRPAPQTAGPAF